MAPKAPIGAAHMTIAMRRKTRRSRCLMPARIGSPGSAHALQREADEQRDEQRLEHRARRQGGDERVGDEAEEEVDGSLGLRRDLRLARTWRRRR